MAVKPTRSTVFILFLLAIMTGGIAFLMFADIPMQQTQKTVQVQHEAFSQ